MSATEKTTATTALCTSSADDVVLRGHSLPKELIGHRSFAEVMYLLVVGSMPTSSQAAMLDAALVTLMEHGLTPTAISTRLTYSSAPEAMQGAVAAGLLSVGSVFVGTMDGCGALLSRIVDADDATAEAADIVQEHRKAKQAIPGFGHPVHRPVDPRAVALRDLAARLELAGPYLRALDELDAALNAGRPSEKRIVLNATGAIAATLADAGIPLEILRGVALVSRSAGLVAHVREEQQHPAMHQLWAAAEDAVPYRPAQPNTSTDNEEPTPS